MAGEVTTPAASEVSSTTEQTTQGSELEALGGKDLVFEGGPLDGQKMSLKELKALDGGTDDPAAKVEGDPKAAVSSETNPSAEETDADPVPSKTGESTDTTVEPAAAATDAKEEPAPKYEPNTQYKVNGQERQFPEWVKPLVNSKETEDGLRTVFQKSDAFDALKPKHETVARERDQAIQHRNDHVQRVQDLISLRDKDLGLFLHETGVTQEALLNYAVKVARLKQEDPSGYVAHLDQIRNSSDQRKQTYTQPAQPDAGLEGIHRANVDAALQLPEVVAFKSKIEQQMGEGQFDQLAQLEIANMRASGEQGYIHPIIVAKRVIEKYGKFLTTAAAPTPSPSTTPATTTNQTKPVGNGAIPARSPVKTMPNVGKGSSISPVAKRPKTLEEVKAKANKELEAIS